MVLDPPPPRKLDTSLDAFDPVPQTPGRRREVAAPLLRLHIVAVDERHTGVDHPCKTPGVVQAATGRTEAAKAQLQKGLDMLPEGQDGQSITTAREVLAQLNAPADRPGSDAAAGTGTGNAAAMPTASEADQPTN